MTDRLLCENEFRTRELVEADRKAAEHNPFGQMLRSAILACWSDAMPAHRWAEIGVALHGIYAGATDERGKAAFQKELTRMVRAKVLRTRRVRGQTLYEVNF